MGLGCKLVLASASPRRRQFFKDLGIDFEVHVSGILERHMPHETHEQYVTRNACEKAIAVSPLGAKEASRTIVVGADTIVISPDNQLLEKPEDEVDAMRMLRLLSGKWHKVVSGFALVDAHSSFVLHSEFVETKVCFRHIFEEEIRAYIASGEPMDKAGAYGIQGKAAAFVTKVEGSYTNVVGLPLCEVIEALKKHANLSLFT